MHHTLNGAVHVPVCVPVQALSGVEFLVKESEVPTGKSGRCRSFEVTVGVGGQSGYFVDLRALAGAAIVTDGGNHAER